MSVPHPHDAEHSPILGPRAFARIQTSKQGMRIIGICNEDKEQAYCCKGNILSRKLFLLVICLKPSQVHSPSLALRPTTISHSVHHKPSFNLLLQVIPGPWLYFRPNSHRHSRCPQAYSGPPFLPSLWEDACAIYGAERFVGNDDSIVVAVLAAAAGAAG